MYNGLMYLGQTQLNQTAASASTQNLVDIHSLPPTVHLGIPPLTMSVPLTSTTRLLAVITTGVGLALLAKKLIRK